VVLATRNRLPLLRQALDALVGRIAAPHEVVVMDLGSTDGSREYLAGLPGIRLLCKDAPHGQAADLNPVFASVAARYTCWLSDDNVLLPGMLDTAVAILDAHPDIGMVALKVKDVTGRQAADAYVGSVWPTGILNCNQGVVRTGLFREIGFFDEQFKTYGIDPDVTTRVLLAGARVVFTRQVAIHHFRDHAAAPGAMQQAERVAGMERARDLYAQKYAALIARRSRWKQGVYWVLRRVLIYPAHRVARRLGLPLERWLGVSERDWINLGLAQYISVFDFIANRARPFYLVQSIPPRLRAAVGAQGGVYG
jgi:GT2 family glycosyltransferase